MPIPKSSMNCMIANCITKLKINDELKYPEELNFKKYTSEFLLGEECQED